MKRIVLKLAAFAARMLPSSIKQALYHFPSLSGFIRRQLNQAAPVGLVPVQIAAGYLAGKSMILDLQSEKDYWLGTYEPELQEAIREKVKPGMVVYDVGANIGYVTLMMAVATEQNGHVFAFEALPSNTKRLKGNIALNNFLDRITVLDYAVVNEPGKTSFWIGPSDDMGKADGSAGRKEIPYLESIQVDGISLDWFVFEMNNPAPDLIKIDIEGGEVLAVQGMKQLFRETKPIILIELHGPESARVTWEVLTNSGYEIRRMEKGYQPVYSIEELDWKSYLIAIPGHGSR